MKDIDGLFFELIRVAVGNADSLSHLPSHKEWKALYDMAQKQSLVGVCFAALQRLGADADEGFERIGMSEMQYLTWMGMTAKIQQRNQEVDRQCAQLGERLKAEGYRYCILKGQSAAKLYTSHSTSSGQASSAQVQFDLRGLRQSGDIDVWVDAPRKVIMEMVQRIAPTTNVREHHLELKVFPDTEVEVHFWPAVIRHFLKNRKLQRWFDGKREEVFANSVDTSNSSNLPNSFEPQFCSPTPEFHAVQMMAHMYHHLFDSGIGLRQVMDYYFVLNAIANENTSSEANTNLTNDTNGFTGNSCSKDIFESINYIGMGRFASAMMYVLQETMGLTREKMLCEPNEEDGKFLLGEIMRGGNFGRHDPRKKLRKGGYLNSFLGGIARNFRYLRFNPFDWFWSPLWRLWYFGWRKRNGYH